jgi:SH3 domain-containing YSC84-like protein 1
VKNLLMLLLICAVAVPSLLAETERDKAVKRMESASQVLQEITEAPDKGIPQEVIEHAKCIAIIPHEVKGGFVVGAAHGRGVAVCRTAHGWSAPSFFSITGGSWGAQIGLEGVDNVLMIMNDQGMARLLSNKFQIGADASAAVGPVGRHAAAGTDWKLDTEILSYARSKGAFAGATLNGAWVTPDEDALRALYGGDVTVRAVLTGKVPPPAEARTLLSVVRTVDEQARQEAKKSG